MLIVSCFNLLLLQAKGFIQQHSILARLEKVTSKIFLYILALSVNSNIYFALCVFSWHLVMTLTWVYITVNTHCKIVFACVKDIKL